MPMIRTGYYQGSRLGGIPAISPKLENIKYLIQMNKKLVYFGCRKQVGHHYHSANNGVISPLYVAANFRDVPPTVFEILDKLFLPSNAGQGCATYVRINNTDIIQWHDYTVDRRPGSNSAFIYSGFIHIREMLDLANINFPDVITRQLLVGGLPFKIITE